MYLELRKQWAALQVQLEGVGSPAGEKAPAGKKLGRKGLTLSSIARTAIATAPGAVPHADDDADVVPDAVLDAAPDDADDADAVDAAPDDDTAPDVYASPDDDVCADAAPDDDASVVAAVDHADTAPDAAAGTAAASSSLLFSVRVVRYAQQAMGPLLCAMAERLSAGGAQRKPKIAKGARDFLPEQVCSVTPYLFHHTCGLLSHSVGASTTSHTGDDVD